MPELFADMTTFVLCALVVAGAQLIYATAGFGAGMFSIALLAMILPDLGPAVATLYVLTFLTEVWVLLHAWRQAKARLLLGLLPTTIVGMWLGTELLLLGNMAWLKRVLGLVVATAGAWFMYDQRRRPGEPGKPGPALDGAETRPRRDRKAWLSLPVGLVAGTLAGLFGTGGPPVILLLKGYRLDKGAFRATLLWFFLLMSVFRGATYLRAGVLSADEIAAAVWLLPASVVGTVLGMVAHRRLSERHFAAAVSVLLVILGVLLVTGGGK